MARNKYPEKTIEMILDTAFQLFAEKGYDKTTIQDIVEAMGMSKGAIYHHFKSKEDIMESLSRRSFIRRSNFEQKDTELTGLEKIRRFAMDEFADAEKQNLDKMGATIIRVPQYLALYLKNCINENAPLFAKMIDEASQDGSIKVEDPQMVAEVFILLLNIWINPFLWDRDEDIFLRQIKTIGDIMAGLGFPLLNDELFECITHYYHKVTA